MSIPFDYCEEFDPIDAANFNSAASIDLGWGDHLHPLLLDAFPDLALDPITGSEVDRVRFAQAVFEAERHVGIEFPDNDGKLDQYTLIQFDKHFGFVPNDANYYIHKGRRILCPGGYDYKVLTYEDKGGLSVYEQGQKSGSTLKGRLPVSMIVGHYGGIYPAHCARVLRNRRNRAGRLSPLSTHYICDRQDDGSGPIVYQCMDTGRVAYHTAKGINSRSVGIDISNQPDPKWQAFYRDKRGMNLKVINNPTLGKNGNRRGPKKVLELHDETFWAFVYLVRDLISVHNLDIRIPRGEKGLEASGPIYHGLVNRADLLGESDWFIGHYHWTNNRWDVAPIFEAAVNAVLDGWVNPSGQ